MHVLFVCNENVARSQEAEKFFVSSAAELSPGSDRYTAASAGVDVRVGRSLDPLVVEVMREVGYEMDHAFRKVITTSMVDEADLVISFKPRDELPAFVNNAKAFRYWPVPDPRGQSLEFHRENRDRIAKLVGELVSELTGRSGEEITGLADDCWTSRTERSLRVFFNPHWDFQLQKSRLE